MKREIKIFKSFEEQEEYQLEQMRNTTVKERFENLFRMQQVSNLFRPSKDHEKILIIQRNGHSQ